MCLSKNNGSRIFDGLRKVGLFFERGGPLDNHRSGVGCRQDRSGSFYWEFCGEFKKKNLDQEKA